MSLKMSKQAILELLDSNEAKYRKTQYRKAKSEFLEQLRELTGYKSTKSIIRYYSKKRKRKRAEKRGRIPKLKAEDITIIKEIWLQSNQPCGKRLHPMLPTWINAMLKRRKIDSESVRRVLNVSSATLDRVLRVFRVGTKHQSNQQTLNALKQSIPIIDTCRTIEKPGHLYADTVAHGGGSSKGSFVWTLTVTDDLTLWTNNRAIWNKGQEGTCSAFLYLLREMPFMKRSINTDNGAEFINYHLQRIIKEKYKRCKLTRSRPYKKNDNARAEERNRHKVRELIGYDRIDDEQCVYLLNQVYQYHNLLTNFFVASTRLILKRRNPATGKTYKKYDKARTPYERVIENINDGVRKRNLKKLRNSLDPIDLQEKTEAALKRLFDFMETKRKKED